MRQTHLFTKTQRQNPADEASKNAQLLMRAGYVHKEMAGVYSLLPLGLMVLNRIRAIISEEMESIGSVELLMSSLQRKEVWEKTGRWDDEAVDVWFKSALKSGSEVGFGWSHEEPITDMMRSFVSSYQDLPRLVHQFQNKLRNEVRAKSGIMRCREFVMKDMYSFATTEEEHLHMYEAATSAYLRVFARVGIAEDTFVTSASGGVFTDKFSHEFQTVCDAGEDFIFVHENGKDAVNEEIFTDATLETLSEDRSRYVKRKAAEVGNIFTFGTGKCEELGLYFTTTEGERLPVYLGSYGIGVTRLMGVIVEKFSDEKGIVWPSAVAPFSLHLLRVSESPAVLARADALYERLRAAGVRVLYDDRPVRAGEKFADADLLGIPQRVILGDRSPQDDTYECVRRVDDQRSQVSFSALLETLAQA